MDLVSEKTKINVADAALRINDFSKLGSGVNTY